MSVIRNRSQFWLIDEQREIREEFQQDQVAGGINDIAQLRLLHQSPLPFFVAPISTARTHDLILGSI
jgi:hypothetical protein